MYFFALSQAPPPVHIEIATKRPVTMVPISMTAQCFGRAEQQADQTIGTITGNSARDDHFLDRRRGEHVNSLAL